MTRGDNIDKRLLLSNAENMQNEMRRATNFVLVWSATATGTNISIFNMGRG